MLRPTGCFVAVVAAALMAGTSLHAHAQDKLRFQLDWAPIGSHAAAHLAQVKGYFRDAGLDVTTVDGKGGTQVVQLVGTGQVDVGQAQLATMAVARGNGMRITSIAGFVRAGDNGFMVPRGRGYKTMKDLEGKRIAYTASSGTGPFLDAFLKASGTSRDKFQVVNVDSASLVSVYTSGNVEAAMSTVAFFEPIVETVRPSQGILFADVGMRLPGYGLVVQESTLRDRGPVLGRFVGAMMRAWNYIFDGHVDEAVDAIIAQRPNDKLDRNILKGQLQAYMPLFYTPATKGKPLGWQSERDWAETIQIMEAVGVLKPGSKPDEYYTNQFIPQ